MITIHKKVGTMAVQVTIANQSNGVHVAGEVHPFIDRFHCTRFDVRERKDHFDAQVGCGSSGLSLTESARLADAFIVANDLARYYKDIGDTLLKKASHERNYVFLLQRLFDNNDVEALTDVFLMTPACISKENVEFALKMLDETQILPGMKGTIHESFEQCFYALPGETVEAICNLLERHPDFKILENGIVDSAIAFLSAD